MRAPRATSGITCRLIRATSSARKDREMRGGKKGGKKICIYTTQRRMILRRVSFFFFSLGVPLNRSSLCGSIIKTCSGFSTGLDDILTGGPRRTFRRTTSHGVVGVFSSTTTSSCFGLLKRQRWSTRFDPAYWQVLLCYSASSWFSARLRRICRVVSCRFVPYLFRDSVGLILIRGWCSIRMRHDGYCPRYRGRVLRHVAVGNIGWFAFNFTLGLYTMHHLLLRKCHKKCTYSFFFCLYFKFFFGRDYWLQFRFNSL